MLCLGETALAPRGVVEQEQAGAVGVVVVEWEKCDLGLELVGIVSVPTAALESPIKRGLPATI